MDPQASCSKSITQSELERMLLDEATEPKALPFSLLEKITNNFHYRQEIGRGGFAVVYRGMLENRAVAVKRLYNTYKYEKEFLREVECLVKVKHKNIVRFLGYCSDTQGNVRFNNGKFVMADVQERLLCFEYLPKGSLDNYIKDASGGLQWKSRYRIIKGICEGLHYLHNINIMHLDLKPSNILIDVNMIPKITDFGLSRSLEEMQSRVIATNMFGTLGYLAPEFTSNLITHKFDLYSLGVIIMEILTGKRGYHTVENVLESWNNRLVLSEGSQHYEQIRVCAEIGIECTQFEMTNRPTSMAHIMVRLAETERQEVVPVDYKCGVLRVHPIELQFPFKHNKDMSCPMYLSNNTDNHVAFRLQADGGSKWDYTGNLQMHGIVMPRSTYTLLVTITALEELPRERENSLILRTSLVNENIQPSEQIEEGDKFFKQVKEQGEGILYVVCDLLEGTPNKIMHFMEHSSIIWCLDAHPTEPWIIMGEHDGRVIIWNYDAQTSLDPYVLGTVPQTIWQSFNNLFNEDTSRTSVLSTKIVARKQWVLTGDIGCIHVYHYGAEPKKIRSFIVCSGLERIISLAIHPTKPYVLSATTYDTINLLDWENDWKCERIFAGHSRPVSQVAFNPRDHDSFVSASYDHKVQVWNLDSPVPIYTLSGHSGAVTCLDFFTRHDEQYLITGSDDQTVKIWDMQHMTCVHTIQNFNSPVTCIISLPDRPYLVTGSKDGLVRFWNTFDYRLERILDTSTRDYCGIRALRYLMESERIAIGHEHGALIMQIEDEEPDDSKSKR